MNTQANSSGPTTIFESKASTTWFFLSTNSSRNTCSTHILIFIVISVIFIIILFLIITIIILRPIHGLIGLGSGHNWSWGGDVILCTHINTQIHKCSWGQLLLGWGRHPENTRQHTDTEVLLGTAALGVRMSPCAQTQIHKCSRQGK